jgi:hypothetical protein
LHSLGFCKLKMSEVWKFIANISIVWLQCFTAEMHVSVYWHVPELSNKCHWWEQSGHPSPSMTSGLKGILTKSVYWFLRTEG